MEYYLSIPLLTKMISPFLFLRKFYVFFFLQQDTKSLVLLIADMTDLPCSVWPGILDIIGKFNVNSNIQYSFIKKIKHSIFFLLSIFL